MTWIKTISAEEDDRNMLLARIQLLGSRQRSGRVNSNHRPRLDLRSARVSGDH